MYICHARSEKSAAKVRKKWKSKNKKLKIKVVKEYFLHNKLFPAGKKKIGI